MTILKRSDDEFEYQINNNLYSFYKEEDEDEDEEGDTIRKYIITLILTLSGSQKRHYQKSYSTRQERDDAFDSLEEEEIDLTDWKI